MKKLLLCNGQKCQNRPLGMRFYGHCFCPTTLVIYNFYPSIQNLKNSKICLLNSRFYFLDYNYTDINSYILYFQLSILFCKVMKRKEIKNKEKKSDNSVTTPLKNFFEKFLVKSLEDFKIFCIFASREFKNIRL